MPILTRPQAEAIYTTMRMLNNFGGRLHRVLVAIRDDGFVYATNWSTRVEIWLTDVRDGSGSELAFEWHADQSAFSAAYGLE